MDKRPQILAALALVTTLLLTPMAMAQAAGAAQSGGGGAQSGGAAGEAAPPKNEDASKGQASDKDVEISFGNAEYFGYRIFIESRKRISALLKKATQDAQETGDAFKSPVGPLLAALNATPPETYLLGPGDKIKVRLWSPTLEVQEATVQVDVQGRIQAPGTQRQIVLRGMTLEQAERAMLLEATRAVNEPSLTVELEEMRTFRVSLVNEAYLPGSWEVPATTTLFNLLLATGGPSQRGSLRRIQIQRANGGTVMVDLYPLIIDGDNDQDPRLQPGDTIIVHPSRTKVRVFGEVFRPAIFELIEGETVADAIAYAGGIKASGVAQSVSVDSVVPGRERVQLDIDILNGDGGKHLLYEGDEVEVASIRPEQVNAVELIGAVDQPRTYQITDGMRVKDLVEAGRGLLPDAYMAQAHLLRRQSDQTYEQLTIDLAAAMRGEEPANHLLQPFDKLRVFAIKDVKWMLDRRVSIKGAVRKPDVLPRSDGMRVTDLLLRAGGPTPEANLRSAFLKRTNTDGSPGPLIKIDIERARAGDSEHNILLQDLDVLELFTMKQLSDTPEQSVNVTGAVLRPGIYTVAKGMTVKGLLEYVGGPTNEARLDRLFLQRRTLDGLLGRLHRLDIKKVMEGDPEHDLLIEPMDELTLQTVLQASEVHAQRVTVFGAVQRPGEYARGENMRLLDLIDIAGGLTFNAGDVIEVAKARKQEESEVIRLTREDVISGGASNVLLEDGDLVSVLIDSSILAVPLKVELKGEVARPGLYMITNRNERLSDLIDRAGGLRDNAWERGVQFARNPELLTTPLQELIKPRLVEVIEAIQDDAYTRAFARSELERVRLNQQMQNGILPFSIAPVPAAPYFMPVGGQAATDDKMPLPMVTKARKASGLEEVLGGNLSVNVYEAMMKPGSPDDIILKDGDIITIPETPATVMVGGPGVILNQGVIFRPGKDLRWYVEQAGGLAPDADQSMVLIIRPSGALFKPGMRTRIEEGDIIYVPTKVMTARIGDSLSDFERAVKSITSGALLFGIFKALAD